MAKIEPQPQKTGPITLCSIDPHGFEGIKRTYKGSYNMPACPPDKPFVSIVIDDATDYKIILQDYWIEHAEHVPVLVPSETIVRDIMATENMHNRGCFVPASKDGKPTEAEIEKAHRTRIAYMEACVRMGDALYAQLKRIDAIPDEYKRYAAELHAPREWAYSAPRKRKIDCPNCAEPVNEGIAMCPHCHAILDTKKAREFGFLPPEPAPQPKPNK